MEGSFGPLIPDEEISLPKQGQQLMVEGKCGVVWGIHWELQAWVLPSLTQEYVDGVILEGNEEFHIFH